MKEEINIKINKATSHVLIGKIITLLLLGIICGFLMAREQEDEYKAGLKLTEESYLANFESYKASQIGSTPTPAWGLILICIFMAIIFFGIYEVLGISIGRTITLIINSTTEKPTLIEK